MKSDNKNYHMLGDGSDFCLALFANAMLSGINFPKGKISAVSFDYLLLSAEIEDRKEEAIKV